jgi:multiple sugar transport system ATP-binding protein
MAGLELTGIRKRFGAVDVIKGVDLTIRSGEFLVFVGPSGCGKSTLLRLIAGLEDVSEGDIRLDGQSLTGVPAARRGLAMVFQSYALYPHMSVRQNLSFGLENTGAPKELVAQKVKAAAEMLRIDPLLERRPGQLSGGQRQRVAIGRAVVREPKVFLFDEPLSNLDAELRVAMRAEIGGLHQRLGNTMIYVTHDQVEAMTMADRIAVLHAGRVEQMDTPLNLYNAPANLFVAGFIGSPRMNFIEARLRLAPDGWHAVVGGIADVPLAIGAGPHMDGAPVMLGARPEHMDIASPDATPFTARTRLVEQLGGESYIHVDSAQGPLLIRQPGQTRVRSGDTVGLVLPGPDRCHVFEAASGAALQRRADTLPR